MNYTQVLGAAVLTALTVYEWVLYLQLKIKARTPVSARIACSLLCLFFAWLMFSSASGLFQHLVCILGIACLMADTDKQGLSELGLQISAKGSKSLYKWNELLRAEIDEQNCSIAFFRKKDGGSISLDFKAEVLEPAAMLMQKHGLEVSFACRQAEPDITSA